MHQHPSPQQGWHGVRHNFVFCWKPRTLLQVAVDCVCAWRHFLDSLWTKSSTPCLPATLKINHVPKKNNQPKLYNSFPRKPGNHFTKVQYCNTQTKLMLNEMLYSLQLIHYALPPVHFRVLPSFKEQTDTLIPNNLQSLTLSQRPLLSLRITQSHLIPAIYRPEDDRLDSEAQGDRKGPSPWRRESEHCIKRTTQATESKKSAL